MPNPQNNSPIKTSDTLDNEFLSRLALEGGMAGMGVGGLVSLAYMLSEAFRDKNRAKGKRDEVEELSPFIPAVSYKSAEGPEDSKPKGPLGGLFDPLVDTIQKGARGAIMVPAAATALMVPAWFAYKYLQDTYSKSRLSQLDRELEVARQDFRDALAGDTKLAADIDSIIDECKATKKADHGHIYPKGSVNPSRTPEDHLGGVAGLAAGGATLTSLVAGYLAYKLLDKTIRTGHPKVEALKAMKELQKRRQALTGITPHINIDQTEGGQLVPRI